MSNNPVIFYWKWCEESIQGIELEKNLKDMISRFSFDLLYVGIHSIDRTFDDQYVLEKVGVCEKILAAHGRKLLMDMDIRREFKSFLKKYPGADAFLTRFVEIPLDENGRGVLELPNIVRLQAGTKLDASGDDYILKAWAFHEKGEKYYDPSTLADITQKVSFLNEDKAGNGSWRSRYSVEAGKDNGNKKALVFPAFRHTIPDPFSPMFYEYFTYMFDKAKQFNLGGAALDEYGYSVVLESTNKTFYDQHYPYTPYLSLEYRKKSGIPLEEDLLHMVYAPFGSMAASLKAINLYLQTIRDTMRKNNDWFYYKTKEVFGKEAFVGVHPTMWGDPADFTIDILHNGIDWWEVRRDYAQTDEYVLIPIRLALAHKWGGRVWYNMWYSMGSLLLDTYFWDTWNSARFGGRTHYLGYECPNEDNVLDLRNPGMLEEVNEMESVIAELDKLQLTQPDSRVLIVFGMEAVTNWRLNGHSDGRLLRNRGNLRKVLQFTQSLFTSGYLCDLVPSTEISNGDVQLKNGKAVYGTQEYDAVIYLCTECMDPGVMKFLKEYSSCNKNLIINGECRYFNDGSTAENEFELFIKNLEYYHRNIMSAGEAIKILRSWKIAGNMPTNGCVYQDGSVIFTAPGVLPHGNPLHIDCEIKGHKVCFDGEDFLFLDMDEAGQIKQWSCGKADLLSIDGRKLFELHN